jgi:hypothetical protein
MMVQETDIPLPNPFEKQPQSNETLPIPYEKQPQSNVQTLPIPYEKQPQSNVEMTVPVAGSPPWTPPPMVEPPDMYDETNDRIKCCSCGAGPGTADGLGTIISGCVQDSGCNFSNWLYTWRV